MMRKQVSRSDGHRTAFGDWIVRHMFAVCRTPGGHLHVGLLGTTPLGAVFIRKTIIQQGEYGVRFWRWRIGRVTWGMSRVVFSVRVHKGCTIFIGKA